MTPEALSKLGQWVFDHLISPLNQNVVLCSSLKIALTIELFLARIITSDEKCILYNRIQRNRNLLKKKKNKKKLHPQTSLVGYNACRPL